MRAIKSIPIEAGSSVTLKPDGYHVMLLQARQLARGEKFSCSIDFQKAGTIERRCRFASHSECRGTPAGSASSHDLSPKACARQASNIVKFTKWR